MVSKHAITIITGLLVLFGLWDAFNGWDAARNARTVYQQILAMQLQLAAVIEFATAAIVVTITLTADRFLSKSPTVGPPPIKREAI